MNHLNFVDAGFTASGKTKIWEVRSLLGDQSLGSVQWWAHWRKYVYAPRAGTVYDPACMQEILDFCKTKTQEHKA